MVNLVTLLIELIEARRERRERRELIEAQREIEARLKELRKLREDSHHDDQLK